MKTRHLLLIGCLALACDEEERDPPDSGGSAAPDAGASAMDASASDAEPQDGGSSSSCPVEGSARALLEELIDETFMSAAHTAAFSGERERGFALQILGVSEGSIGFASLISECVGPSSFDRYCEAMFRDPSEPVEPFWMTRDRCSRLACQAYRRGTVEVWFTMLPIASPTELHPFTYPTLMPAGEAIYDPNPHVLWHVDVTDPMRTVVTATIGANVVITPDGDAPIDLSHTGSTTASLDEANEGMFDLVLSLPRLASEPITVDVELIGHTGAGRILAGDRLIATIATSEAVPLSYDWSPCD